MALHPIPFRDPIRAAQAHDERAGLAARHAEALRQAGVAGYDAGYQNGYVDAAQMGLWTGALIGCIGTGMIMVGVYLARAWIGTL